MNKEAARALFGEIAAALEAPPPIALAPIVRKAARLAAMLGSDVYLRVFQSHLDGAGSRDPGAARISWSTPDAADAASRLVISDRALSDPGKCTKFSLDELDRRLARLQKAIGEEPVGSGELRKTLEEMHAVETRIGNRVGVFLAEVAPILAKNEPEVTSSANEPVPRKVPRKIFIGHGGSSTAWKDLQSFLNDRLGLECVEFNTESQAGCMTVERLAQMLEESRLAFLVATGEDTHRDGTVHARENVIHETGLFQAKLGFKNAIVLLEDGCTKFSNIHGVTDIRFPKGNVMAVSEEIRRVLEREGILPSAPF